MLTKDYFDLNSLDIGNWCSFQYGGKQFKGKIRKIYRKVKRTEELKTNPSQFWVTGQGWQYNNQYSLNNKLNSSSVPSPNPHDQVAVDVIKEYCCVEVVLYDPPNPNLHVLFEFEPPTHNTYGIWPWSIFEKNEKPLWVLE